MHELFHIRFAYLILLMACVLTVAGICMPRLRDKIHSSSICREALLWVGGFIIYAALDYFILMR